MERTSPSPERPAVRPPRPPTIRECAWCRRVQVNGAWRVEVPGEWPPDGRRTHGICPPCAAALFPGRLTA